MSKKHSSGENNGGSNKPKSPSLEPWRIDTVSGKRIVVQAYDETHARMKIKEEYSEDVQEIHKIE